MPRKRTGRPRRELGRKLYIFCEGENTEPIYLNYYKLQMKQDNSVLRKDLIEAVVVEKINKNTAVQLVDKAIEKQETVKSVDKAVNRKSLMQYSQESIKEDQFWVVFDRESVAKYSTKMMIAAFNKANQYNINIAISNVCIEVWLLLHLDTNVPGAYSSHDDLKKNSRLKKKLEENNLPIDTKSRTCVEKIMRELVVEHRVKQARILAERMCKNTEDAAPINCAEHELNPYTGFYKLLDAIDDFVEKKKE